MDELERARAFLRAATDVLVITGAGISAESGIPTFRSDGGYWRSHDPTKLATLRSFNEDPAMVWEWYDHRRSLIARASPNAGHVALSSLEEAGKNVFIITQNVDDLHERAKSTSVLHIHGSIWEVTCLAERRTFPHREVPLRRIPPLCQCGSLVRPNIVWFDEDIPPAVLDAIEAYYETRRPQVVLVIGTEATFDYIRDFALRGKRMGATLIEVNPSSTSLTEIADYSIRENAGPALARLTKDPGT